MAKKQKKPREFSVEGIVQACTGCSKEQAERIAKKLDGQKVQELYKAKKGGELRAMIASPDQPKPEKKTEDKKES